MTKTFTSGIFTQSSQTALALERPCFLPLPVILDLNDIDGIQVPSRKEDCRCKVSREGAGGKVQKHH